MAVEGDHRRGRGGVGVVLQDVGLFARPRLPPEDLAAEAVTLARIASADDLKEIARWFDRVVKDGLVRQAERIPEHGLTPAERQAIFAELARQLGDTAARTEEATADVPIEAKVALERIRESARFGQRKMSELAGGR